MAHNYIEYFKLSIDNPYNIKGFHTQFNSSNVRQDINIKDLEAQLLNEKVETKVDINNMVNNILNQANVKRATTSQRPISKKTITSTPNMTRHSSLGSTPSPFSQNQNNSFTFTPSSSININDTLEAQFEKIEIESLKGKVRTLMKDLLIQDPNYDIESYEAILKTEGLTKNILLRVHSLLEADLASYEGRTLVQDAIVVMAGFAEGMFDGKREVFGHNINLKGLSDTLEVSLRKRRSETSAIHTSITEVFGFGPGSKIFLDVAISAASTIQHNSRNISNIAAAVKASERGKP